MKLHKLLTILTISALHAVAQTKPLDMKLLVAAGDANEPSLQAIRYFLDHLGTPYDVVVAKTSPTLPALFAPDGSKGYYQGIILTSGNLAFADGAGWKSAIYDLGWGTALDAYARDYKVRTISYYTYPEARYGLTYTGATSTTATGSPVSFTAAAATYFPYLNRTNPISVKHSYVYLASTVAASGETTTPILTMGTSSVMVYHKKADGREYVALTMDNSPYLVHSMAYNYGLINWVTRGIFLGSRKIYLTPQNDDLFLANDLYVDSKPECKPYGNLAADPTYDPALHGCPTARMTGDDLAALVRWQDNWTKLPQFSKFRVTHAYNGYGTTQDGGAPANDTLVSSSKSLRSKFIWINHTYHHEHLDCYEPVAGSGICNPANYAQSLFEITENVKIATSLGLPLDKSSMVTPNISGLNNPNFLAAAKAAGLQYLVSDTSRNDYLPARPNEGIFSALEPSILYIPRRATNIFYNNSSAAVGAAGSLPDEYNFFFGPNGVFRLPGGAPFFSTQQSYSDIVNREADNLITYMLRYEIYPSMFHQANYIRHSGSRSLFSDVLDNAMQKYMRITNLPVQSLTQTEMGLRVKDRMTYNTAGVRGVITPGVRVTLTAGKTAKVPLTGLCATGCESYGGQSLSNVPVNAGATVSLTIR